MAINFNNQPTGPSVGIILLAMFMMGVVCLPCLIPLIRFKLQTRRRHIHSPDPNPHRKPWRWNATAPSTILETDAATAAHIERLQNRLDAERRHAEPDLERGEGAPERDGREILPAYESQVSLPLYPEPTHSPAPRSNEAQQ